MSKKTGEKIYDHGIDSHRSAKYRHDICSQWVNVLPSEAPVSMPQTPASVPRRDFFGATIVDDTHTMSLPPNQFVPPRHTPNSYRPRPSPLMQPITIRSNDDFFLPSVVNQVPQLDVNANRVQELVFFRNPSSPEQSRARFFRDVLPDARNMATQGQGGRGQQVDNPQHGHPDNEDRMVPKESTKKLLRRNKITRTRRNRVVYGTDDGNRDLVRRERYSGRDRQQQVSFGLEFQNRTPANNEVVRGTYSYRVSKGHNNSTKIQINLEIPGFQMK